MRHSLIIAVILAASAGAAMAQEPQDTGGANPHWLRRPSAADIARFYPKQARKERRGARVVIECSATAEGRMVNCTLLEENPAGDGFGKAALRLGPIFRLSSTKSDGSSVEGLKINMPIVFAPG